MLVSSCNIFQEWTFVNGTARREMSCRVRSRENSRDASPMSEKLSRSRENGRMEGRIKVREERKEFPELWKLRNVVRSSRNVKEIPSRCNIFFNRKKRIDYINVRTEFLSFVAPVSLLKLQPENYSRADAPP